MAKAIFYTVSWSRNCILAEKEIKKAKINFQKISLDNADLLEAAAKELGINKLPVLKINGKCFKGLSEITSYVRTL